MDMKRFNLYLVLFIAVGIFFLAACTGTAEAPIEEAEEKVNLAEESQVVPVAGGSYTDVSADGLAAMLADKDFPLINVHIPYEGEIEGTDQHIPFNEIDQYLDQLPEDKDAQIVLYCRSGSMSGQAASKLVELGYTDVWNLDGGMIAWSNSGRELINR